VDIIVKYTNIILGIISYIEELKLTFVVIFTWEDNKWAIASVRQFYSGSFHFHEIESMAAPSIFAGDKKVLICWFSQSGSTKRVVDVLQPRVKADLFQIQESGPSTAPDLAPYDVFIIACPVWYYKAPPAVKQFVQGANFAGKPVVALPTDGSGAGGFLKDFARDVKNGQFIAKEGFTRVNSMSDDGLKAKVTEWLRDL
jgi:flavodoxin